MTELLLRFRREATDGFLHGRHCLPNRCRSRIATLGQGAFEQGGNEGVQHRGLLRSRVLAPPGRGAAGCSQKRRACSAGFDPGPALHDCILGGAL